MKVLVAKNGKVIPGQEALFKKLVLQNSKELIEIDAWLRQNIRSYADEMTRNPILDWQKESEEELFSAADRFGTGEIYYYYA